MFRKLIFILSIFILYSIIFIPKLEAQTPTPNENSINNYHEVCRQRIVQAEDVYCKDILSEMRDCYSNIDPDHGIYSCNNDSLAQTTCADIFTKIIEDNIKNVSGRTCTEDTDGFQYGKLREIFSIKYTTRLIREGKITPTPGGPTIVYPSITVTQAVIEDELIEEAEMENSISDTGLNQAWNTFNCGFANGAKVGKNACCTNTFSDLVEDKLSAENTDEIDWKCHGLVSWIPNLCDFDSPAKVAKDNFKKYLENNELASKFQELITEEGVLPQCFVGTCVDSVCKPEATTAICAKYIQDDNAAYKVCDKCFSQNNDGEAKYYYSAIGCIDTSFSGILSALFSLALGIAGTAALFCIIYAAFMMQTSTNNPEKIQKAQETITSCITGLILIIFSVFILRVIGVDLLQIPGFNGDTANETNKTSNPPTPIPTIIPTTTIVLSVTNIQATIYIGPGDNYSVPNRHTITNILGRSVDGRWLYVDIDPLPPRANNRGYILSSSVNFTATILPEFDTPNWLPNNR